MAKKVLGNKKKPTRKNGVKEKTAKAQLKVNPGQQPYDPDVDGPVGDEKPKDTRVND